MPGPAPKIRKIEQAVEALWNTVLGLKKNFPT